MTYTQRMKQQYATLIVFARAWREAYRLARAHHWTHAQALEIANLSVTMS